MNDAPMNDDDLAALLTRTNHGVLTTIKRDGRPQISAVTFGYHPHTRVVEVSVTATRAKTHKARRDPRVRLYVESAEGWSYTLADGTAELTEEAREVDDATTEALVSYYRHISGEHPDWQEFRQVMVAERRILMTVRVDRFYGVAR